jgi:hypothetical protein
MSKRLLLCLAVACASLFAMAGSAMAAKPVPTVKSVAPMKLKVGAKLTVRGKNFIPGRNKNRVFFLRSGGGLAWARAERASKTKLVVKVPATVTPLLKGKAVRLRLRVLAKSFGKVTSTRLSPTISPAAGSVTGPGTGGAPDGDCDGDKILNGVDTDDDNDTLTDSTEATAALDPCDADTDGDGVDDGYEYRSAVDLNSTTLGGVGTPLPYPGKRPYPNALDSSDAKVDYDGDGLTLADEFSLWARVGGHAVPLNYSDGNQVTDGVTRDDLRDADNDGLGNWDEAHGPMQPDWWKTKYDGTNAVKETPYPVTYAGTDLFDPDSDGDGVLDGADDQDHDGLPNSFEVHRPSNWPTIYISLAHAGTAQYARVNPFNPCKPVWSPTCHQHPPFGYYGTTEDWESAAPTGPPGADPSVP